MSEQYICHHGVKGMKWGIKKYQDASGKLTGLGKARVQELKREQEAQITSDQSRQEYKQQKSLNAQAARQDSARRKGRVAAVAALTIIGAMAAKQILNNIASNRIRLDNARTANKKTMANTYSKNRKSEARNKALLPIKAAYKEKILTSKADYNKQKISFKADKKFKKKTTSTTNQPVVKKVMSYLN